MTTRNSNKRTNNASKPGKSRAAFRTPAPVAGGAVVSHRMSPVIRQQNDSTIVKNTELMISVTSGTGAVSPFTPSTQFLHATKAAWVAQIADCYSKYRWRKLRIIYIPICPTTTTGTVSMALSYDALDGAFTSMVQMSQTFRNITFPGYAGYEGVSILNNPERGNAAAVYVDVDVNRFMKRWYPVVAQATINGMVGVDQTDYIPCSLTYATEGFSSAVGNFIPGNLYLQYEIEFIEPVNPTVNG